MSDDIQKNDHCIDCHTAAGGLGWILCPIIDSVSKFVLNLYVEWVE